MEIKVSIIIPVYNMEKYLSVCLDSIFCQTLKDIEVICINDGSTDNTREILRLYEKKYPNIVIMNQKREGAGKARNKGLHYAKGQFVAFMDPDDYYPSEDVLEVLLNNALKYGVKASGGNVLMYMEGIYSWWDKQRFDKDEMIKFSEFQYCYGYCRFIYDSNMLRENDICFPDYKRNQDPIFMLKALSCADMIWVTSKDVHVTRITDKKIKYNSRHVMCDLAKGLYDIIHYSGQRGYNELIRRIVNEELIKWKVYFFAHILNGNQLLYDIMKEMNKDIYFSGYSKEKEYYLDATIDEMDEYIKKYMKMVEQYIHVMEGYNEIIIYGAGKIGKSVFDIIEQRDYKKFGGFAVSNSKPEGRARGKNIYCIDSFLDRKDSLLIIIAASSKASMEMESNVRRLGFENRLVINEEIIDVSNFKIVNDLFAV